VNSREKGKRGERRWRDMLRAAGFLKAHRGVQFQGGTDSPDVQCPELPGLHFEVKAVERLNVWDAMAQAVRDSAGRKTPVVAHARNRSGWLVTMRAEDWLDLVRRSDLVATEIETSNAHSRGADHLASVSAVQPSTCDLPPSTAPEARPAA
jgi:hypothetical protein